MCARHLTQGVPNSINYLLALLQNLTVCPLPIFKNRNATTLLERLDPLPITNLNSIGFVHLYWSSVRGVQWQDPWASPK